MGEKNPSGRAPPNLLDAAIAALVELIREQDTGAASGRFGVVLTLERGRPRKVALLLEPTVMTARER